MKTPHEALPNWFELVDGLHDLNERNMNTYREAFKEQIKRLRKARGWSQETAAKKIGIKRPTLGAYEEGRAEPPFEILVAICDTYNTKDLYGMLTGEVIFSATSC